MIDYPQLRHLNEFGACPDCQRILTERLSLPTSAGRKNFFNCKDCQNIFLPSLRLIRISLQPENVTQTDVLAHSPI